VFLCGSSEQGGEDFLSLFGGPVIHAADWQQNAGLAQDLGDAGGEVSRHVASM